MSSAAPSSGPEAVRSRTGAWESVRLLGPGGLVEATFLTGLGMVGSSLRHRGEEILGQRSGPEAYAERKSTFGIPLLHPWANRLGDWEYEQNGRHVVLDRSSEVLKADPDTGLPIHGALAASPFWELVDTGSDRDSAWLEAGLDYGAHEELLAVFPFPHRLEFRAAVSAEELEVRLTVTASGDAPVPIAFGFHPYIALPGSRREEWEIELPVRSRAVLDDRGIPTGREERVTPEGVSGSLGSRTFEIAGDGWSCATRRAIRLLRSMPRRTRPSSPLSR
jgi:aldose 1-epimerase